MIFVKSRKMKLTVIGMLCLGVTSAASAAEVGQQTGGSISLNDGDTVTVNGDAAIYSNTTGGSGLQISGAATITSTGTGTSVYLNNGRTNDLGDGTSISVTYSSGSTTGLSIGATRSGTSVQGKNVYISSVTENNTATATGILMGTGSGLSLSGNTEISASGKRSVTGISLGENSGIELKGETLISATSSSSAYNARVIGISSSTSGNTIQLGNATRIEVTGGGTTTGMFLQGANVVANNLQIHVVSDWGTGITAENLTQLNLGSGSRITSASQSNYGLVSGVSLSGSSDLIADNLGIELNNTAGGTGLAVSDNSTADLGRNSYIDIRGKGSDHALWVTSGGSVTANQLTISNVLGHGITVQVGEADLGSGSQIIIGNSTGTAGGNGVYSERLGCLFKSKDITIHVDLGTGAYAKNKGVLEIGAGSHIVSKNGNGVVADASFSLGRSLEGKESRINEETRANFMGTETQRNTILSGNIGALAITNGAVVNLAYTDIRTTSSEYNNETTGIVGILQGVVHADHVTVDATAANSTAVLATQGGEVYLTGETVIRSSDLDIAIQAGKEDEYEDTGKVSVSGKADIQGSLWAYKNGIVDMNLTNGSYLSGGTFYDSESNAEINLSLTDSTWDMKKDSQVTHLNLNQGTVSFQTDLNSPVLARSLSNYGNLKVLHLSGNNGIFSIRTDLENLQGDLVQITGSSLGDHQVMVNNQGGADVDPTKELVVVETADGIASFALKNRVEVGGYLYDIKKNGTDWALYSTGKVTNPGTAGVNLFSGAYLLNYAETQTLLKRMGDLRDGIEGGNLWVRGFGGEFTSSSDGFLHGFDMNYAGTQVGYDKKFTREDGKGEVYLGGMIGYSKGNLDYGKVGSGSINSKTIGAYWTHIGSTGFYADFIFKYGWMKNDFKTLDSAGDTVTGKDIHTQGFTGSLELGRRYYFDQIDKERWYIEPQTQLIVSHQSGDRFQASNGLRYKVDSFRSTLVRVGSHVGYEVKRGENPINAYLKFSWIREFEGNVDYTLNNAKESTSYGGSWHVWGIGMTAQFSGKHNLYFDIERASGGKFNQPWAVSGGYRFNW